MHGLKEIGYSTPRQLQALKKRDNNRWHGRNKTCKVTKGKHEYTELDIEYFFQRPWMKQWRCKCGKKGPYEFIDKPSWLK